MSARPSVPNPCSRPMLLTLLAVGACAEPLQDSGDSPDPHGPASWSDCVEYPTNDVTCDEVCADEGKLCAPLACDGYTAQRFVMAQCTVADEGLELACEEPFDVTTSHSTSAHCCCW